MIRDNSWTAFESSDGLKVLLRQTNGGRFRLKTVLTVKDAGGNPIETLEREGDVSASELQRFSWSMRTGDCTMCGARDGPSLTEGPWKVEVNFRNGKMKRFPVDTEQDVPGQVVSMDNGAIPVQVDTATDRRNLARFLEQFQGSYVLL